MSYIRNKKTNKINSLTIEPGDKIFYICSYTGCGTMMLSNALDKLGYRTRIVHSPVVPTKLEYTNRDGDLDPYSKNNIGFNFNGEKIPDNLVSNFYVIYIYKNPLDVIYSRFINGKDFSHLVTINKRSVDLKQVLTQKKDLYGLENFFDTYTTPNPNRNYKIICVNYSMIFSEQDKLSELLGVGPLNLFRKETNRHIDRDIHNKLISIYKPFIIKLSQMPFIKIV